MDSCQIHCPTADSLQSTAKSLTETLYVLPMALLLSGELGAGKTTLLQGWLKSIGAGEHVTSPTFALEQEYQTTLGPVLHIDLYRLTQHQALDLLRHSEDRHVTRCIEWPEKAGKAFEKHVPSIRLRLEEEGSGRQLSVEFDDLKIPARKEIEQWRDEAGLPENVAAHCDAVADLSESLGKQLIQRGVLLRPLALRRAAETHDLFRFVDFHEGAGPKGYEELPERKEKHDHWRRTYPLMRHESACAQFLRDRGYEGLASMVEPHGLHLPELKRTTIEQKILFYADKRVIGDKVVTVDERFEDFAIRYGKGSMTPDQQVWLKEVQAMERELFPDSPPGR